MARSGECRDDDECVYYRRAESGAAMTISPKDFSRARLSPKIPFGAAAMKYMSFYMVFFCYFLLLLSSPASADTYRYLSKDGDGAVTFINESSINRVKNTVTVWTLTITGEYMKGDSPKTAYYLMQQSFQCRTQRFRAIEMSAYGPAGSPISSDDQGSADGAIEPGTIEQDLYKRVCLNKRNNGTFEGKTPLSVATEFRNDVLSLKR